MLNNRVEGSRWHGSSSNINSQTNLSIELSEALSYISADLPRDEWVKVAAAWKSAGGDFDSWDEWSSKGQSYNSKDVLSVWNSLSVEGGIGPGTLFFLAKQYGYSSTTPGIDSSTKKPFTADMYSKNEVQLKARKRAEELLDQCAYATADHPYLKSKRINPSLMPWLDKGNRLLLPVIDLNGVLHSLQFISGTGQKQFLTGGAIRGHFYQIWSGKRAIVICEGYATGVTLYSHYTPECSVVVAFNAGNLRPVAEVLRRANPEVNIIIAGDSDNSGTGQKAAQEAALAVGGQVSLPDFSPDVVGSDWNDHWNNQNREEVA